MDFNPSSLPIDYLKGFSIPFDLKTGMSPVKETGKRHLSDMKGMYSDAKAEAEASKEADTAPAKPKVEEDDFFIDDTPDEFDDEDDDIDEEDDDDIDEDEEDGEEDDEDGN